MSLYFPNKLQDYNSRNKSKNFRCKKFSLAAQGQLLHHFDEAFAKCYNEELLLVACGWDCSRIILNQENINDWVWLVFKEILSSFVNNAMFSRVLHQAQIRKELISTLQEPVMVKNDVMIIYALSRKLS